MIKSDSKENLKNPAELNYAVANLIGIVINKLMEENIPYNLVFA